MADLSAGALAS